MPVDLKQEARSLIRSHLAARLAHLFKVDPAKQDISLLNILFEYEDFESEKTELLVQVIVPKLIQCLQLWLGSGLANIKEVWPWYKGWRGFLSPRIRDQTEGFYLMALLIKQHL